MSSRQESCKLPLCLVQSCGKLCNEATHARTHARTHTVPYLVCLGDGVEGRSEEWGPLLALVPLLREAPTASGGGGEGREM